MDLFSDELLKLIQTFQKNDVGIVLVGGMAVTLHGYKRFTEDVDLFFYPSDENGIKLIKALEEFGYDTSEFTETDFSQPLHFRLYEKDSYIDLLNATVGVTPDEIFSHATSFPIQGLIINVIHINQLIQNKIALNTSKDRADAEALLKIRNKK
jgi:hypothetical protein